MRSSPEESTTSTADVPTASPFRAMNLVLDIGSLSPDVFCYEIIIDIYTLPIIDVILKTVLFTDEGVQSNLKFPPE